MQPTGETARPPELLPGRSALEEVRRWEKWSVVLVVSALAVVAASFLGFEARAVLIAVLALPGMAGAVVSSQARMAELRARRREREAGYTTEFGEGRDLWQLEPRTGAVLRRPGEPLITLAEARRRAERA